jgi:hypothetical protein
MPLALSECQKQDLSFFHFIYLVTLSEQPIVTSIFQMVVSRDLFYSTCCLRWCRLFCCKPTERENIAVAPYGELELRMSVYRSVVDLSWNQIGGFVPRCFINQDSIVHDVLTYWPSCTRHLFVQHYIPMHFILVMSGIIYDIELEQNPTFSWLLSSVLGVVWLVKYWDQACWFFNSLCWAFAREGWKVCRCHAGASLARSLCARVHRKKTIGWCAYSVIWLGNKGAQSTGQSFIMCRQVCCPLDCFFLPCWLYLSSLPAFLLPIL